jgi:fumarate reductase flavoprotein subunit
LLKAYVDAQLATYEWMKSIGVAFKAVELSSAQSVPRTHPVDAQALLDRLRALVEATGRVETLLNAPVSRLLQDVPDGRVTGVRATIDGTMQSVAARRGVVLAAGGFSRNEDMLRQFVPHEIGGVCYGGAGNTGDGIRMAWALGAGFRDMAYIKGTFGFHPNARTQEGRGWTKLPVYRGAIAVNQQGKRYVDESTSYKLLGDAVLQQPGAIAYQIFDQDIMDSGVDGVSPFDFRSTKKRGLVFEAATPAELARKIGVDAEQLTATIARYNGFVDAGVDADFGRDGLSAHYGKLVKIDRAPFYAYPSTSGIIATYCGLTVDADTRVLNVFGEPIAGLFAAGELMGGFHGVSYMTGSSLGKCVIFGRIAGRLAAQK